MQLMITAAIGDRDAQTVAADFHEQRGLQVTAAALRLNARGYAVPAHTLDKLRPWGFCEGLADNPQLSSRIVRAMLRELREYAEHVFRTTEITVYCTACGKQHRGGRLSLAKFRKCCSASTKWRKHCRTCGVAITREQFFARPYNGGVEGWKTCATCEGCGCR